MELSRYLVEVEPHGHDNAHGFLSSRARSASGDARFLRSIYVPEDDRWFLLYEGVSAADVLAAAERIQARVVSVAVSREVPREEEA